MEFIAPPLQPIGSTDCELYAGSYIAKLFGLDISVETLRPVREQQMLLVHTYLINELGLTGIKTSWREDPMWANRDGYKEWVLQHTKDGYIGFAVIHLIPEMGHCVALLDADSDGVLVADSVRGIVKDSWEKHLTYSKQFSPSRVDAWYKAKEVADGSEQRVDRLAVLP